MLHEYREKNVSEGAFAEIKIPFHILPWFCQQIEKFKIKVMFLTSSALTSSYPEHSLSVSKTWSSDKSVISATSSVASLAQQSLANRWKMAVSRENGAGWSTCRCRPICSVYSVLAFSESELRKNRVWWQVPKHQQTMLLQRHNHLLHMSNNTLNMLQSGRQNRLTT